MAHSYLPKVAPQDLKKKRDARKSDVKESLMKFLDECGDADLIMAAGHSPRKVTNLSVSEHGASKRYGETGAGPKRRATKMDMHSLSSSNEHDENRGASLGMSEHGTPATQKAPLVSLYSPTLETTRENLKLDLDHSFSEDSIKAGKRGIKMLDKSDRRSRLASTHSATLSSSRYSRRPSQSNSSRIQRSKSDRIAPHSSRSDSSKPQIRRRKSEIVTGEGVAVLNLGQHLSSDRHRRNRSRLGGDDDNHSVGSSRSSFSTMSSMTGKPLGLDAGPLNAFFKPERRQSMNASSAASIGPGVTSGDSQDDEYLRLRKQKQDEILSEVQKNHSNSKNREQGDVHAMSNDGFQDDDDDDRPKVKSKKSALERFKKGISKTGKVTKSTAKGTVNVVRDPKRAAKKVGDFAKDMGKETGKMLLDPKLAAKTAVSLGKDVTKGTFKVTKDVGKGVAKGSYGLTKSVAMTGVNATSMVVGTALDGAGKVVNGATGLIFKNGTDDVEDQYADYDASELSSRRKSGASLMDRVSNPFGTAPKPTSDVSTRPSRNSHSVLPGLLVSNNSSSYDF